MHNIWLVSLSYDIYIFIRTYSFFFFIAVFIVITFFSFKNFSSEVKIIEYENFSKINCKINSVKFTLWNLVQQKLIFLYPISLFCWNSASYHIILNILAVLFKRICISNINLHYSFTLFITKSIAVVLIRLIMWTSLFYDYFIVLTGLRSRKWRPTRRRSQIQQGCVSNANMH